MPCRPRSRSGHRSRRVSVSVRPLATFGHVHAQRIVIASASWRSLSSVSLKPSLPKSEVNRPAKRRRAIVAVSGLVVRQRRHRRRVAVDRRSVVLELERIADVARRAVGVAVAVGDGRGQRHQIAALSCAGEVRSRPDRSDRRAPPNGSASNVTAPVLAFTRDAENTPMPRFAVELSPTMRADRVHASCIRLVLSVSVRPLTTFAPVSHAQRIGDRVGIRECCCRRSLKLSLPKSEVNRPAKLVGPASGI